MFVKLKVKHCAHGKTTINDCAVDLSQGLIIPFSKDVDGAVQDFNEGMPYGGFCRWPVEECFDAQTGEPLRPASLDGPPELVVVNVLGLDYGVPKPVADYLTSIKGALTAMCMRVDELQRPKSKREAETDARWKKGFEDFVTGKS